MIDPISVERALEIMLSVGAGAEAYFALGSLGRWEEPAWPT
jgi:hypothetical protein